MKLIQLITMGLSMCVYSQNRESLLNKPVNPSTLTVFDTLIFYSNLNVLNAKIGLYETEIGSVFKINDRVFKSSINQYGYLSFKESTFEISSAQKLTTSIDLGVSLNFHHLYIAESDNYNALSFNLGIGYKKERFTIYLLLQNPLNASYLENDLMSSFIVSSFYYWNENLKSELNVSQSLHLGLNVNHKLSYTYQNKVSCSIIQGSNPFEYGFNLGYKIKRFQFYSQYNKSSYMQSSGFSIFYTLGDV